MVRIRKVISELPCCLSVIAALKLCYELKELWLGRGCGRDNINSMLMPHKCQLCEETPMFLFPLKNLVWFILLHVLFLCFSVIPFSSSNSWLGKRLLMLYGI